MSMSLVQAVQGEAQLRELPMPAPLYGVLLLVGFGLLLAILWAFRNTANKVRVSGIEHGGEHSSGHGSGHSSGPGTGTTEHRPDDPHGQGPH
jgi:hypothetical protein